jgi:hypothetical protein
VRALLVVVLLLLGLAVIADRVGVGLAEDAVAEQLAGDGRLAGPPEVEITGFPFLTQALSGHYDDVRVAATAEELGQPAGTSGRFTLRGVDLPLSDVLGGLVTEVPVDRVDGVATLSYPLLARELGGDATVARQGDGLRVTRTEEVLGVEVPLAGAGTVALDGSDLVVTVEEVSVVGVDVPGFVVARLPGLLDFRYPVPPLPFDLQLTGLRVADLGVEVDVAARDTVFR